MASVQRDCCSASQNLPFFTSRAPAGGAKQSEAKRSKAKQSEAKRSKAIDTDCFFPQHRTEQMKRRGLTPDGQTLEGLVSGAEKSQEEFQQAEAGKVVVSDAGGRVSG